MVLANPETTRPPAVRVPDQDVHEAGTSPHQKVKPEHTPDEEKHKWFNMRADKAEALLDMCYKSDVELSKRTKIVAVLKRKLAASLLVPTSNNASFHIFKEVELVTAQATRAIFFDLTRTGPTKRGSSVYYNFETDSCNLMRKWFSLEERRENGLGMAMLRNKGQVLVMARPPFLVEHMSNEEAECVKMTAGLMTLNCRGIPRFAPPPPANQDSEEDQKERQRAADAHLTYAWFLIKEMAERGCQLDRHWYYSLASRFGRTWLSYLSDEDASESEEGSQEVEEEEEEPGVSEE